MTIVDRWRRVPGVYKAATMASLAVILIGALVVALILGYSGSAKGTTAARDARAVAKCVNDSLGDRNPATAKDARAHILWAEALSKVLAAPKGEEQEAAYIEFVKATNVYVRTLEADQAYRVAHPLGRC